MFPKLIFNDDMYIYLMILCFAAAMFVFSRVAKRYKMPAKAYNFYFNLGLIAIAAGILSAILFQVIYDCFEMGVKGAFKSYKTDGGPGMTFLGGLTGGIGTFLIGTFLVAPKLKSGKIIRENWHNILRTFGPCVAAAQIFGRLACFCAGCCYGKPTDSFIGITFPGESVKRYPTQLFEIAFAIIMLLVCLKFINKSMIIYLYGYGIFRFLVEFLRGDERGEIFWQSSLSPSQFLALFMIAAATILLVLDLTKHIFPNKNTPIPEPQQAAQPLAEVNSEK